MKNLLFLFTLIFASTFSYAQDIPEKANTITITLSESVDANELVLKVLNNKKYEIKDNGKTSSSVTTAPKTLKNNTRVTFNAKIEGSEVILTGKIVVAAQGSMVIANKGTKGTPIIIAWEEMTKIAKDLGGSAKYEVK